MGFRDALSAQAIRLGIRGWVRNRADGSVEALLQGDDDQVERLIAWARRGPPLAHVAVLEEQALEPGHEATYLGFERWPTA